MVKSRPFLVILCALFLSSCGWWTTDTKIEVLPQPTEVLIPAQNRSCPAIPAPPNPDAGASQQDVAAWLPEVFAAHGECRSDLRTTVRIVDAHNAEARRVAAENAKIAEDAE